MRKFGYFLLIFIPIIIAEILQILASFIMIGIAVIISLFEKQNNPLATNLFNDILPNSDINGLLMIIYSLLSICIFGIWYYIRYQADYLPFKRTEFKSKLLIKLSGIVFLVPGTQFGSALICSIIIAFNPKAFEEYEALMETAWIGINMSFILFIYSVICAPICEELIFRGVTLSIGKRIFPFWLANTLQALLFGVYHLNFVQASYAFVLGLILGYVCQKGKSIYFSIFLHLLFNLWAVVVSPLVGSLDPIFVGLLIIVGTVVSLITGFILFNYGTKQTKRLSL